MDEPTSAISASEIEILFKTIRQLKEKNVGIIYISHRLEEIFEIADRLTVLRDGNCVGTRQTDQVTKNQLIKMILR